MAVFFFLTLLGAAIFCSILFTDRHSESEDFQKQYKVKFWALFNGSAPKVLMRSILACATICSTGSANTGKLVRSTANKRQQKHNLLGGGNELSILLGLSFHAHKPPWNISSSSSA